MDVNRDIQCHFKRFPKYITPNCIIFYDYKEYNNYMKEYIECKKKYKNVDLHNSSHSKK
jgi:hypothetical protein